jgi:hypothetical protein
MKKSANKQAQAAALAHMHERVAVIAEMYELVVCEADAMRDSPTLSVLADDVAKAFGKLEARLDELSARAMERKK